MPSSYYNSRPQTNLLITTITTTYSLTVAACPTHASGPPCVCEAGYEFDATRTSCVSTCPVLPLTAPPFSEACAQVLENINSTEVQKNAACGTLTPDMQAAVDRFASKLANTYIVGTQTPIPLVITSQRRSYEYQAHFTEIWEKMKELVRLMKEDPAMQTACATRRAEIAAEKGCDNADVCTSCYSSTSTRRSHCLKGKPAAVTAAGDTHINGTAIDVGYDTLDPLQDVLDGRNPPQDIQEFLDAPTATGLRWGGYFTDPDPVHFQIPR